jgi:hypothetical protein
MSPPTPSVVHSAAPTVAALSLLLALTLTPVPLRAQQVAGSEQVPPPPADSVSVLRGTVVDHRTGEPLDGAAVALASGPGGTPGIGTRVTNRNGHFLFQRVPPGTYRLTVNLLGYSTLWETLRVEEAQEMRVVLTLSVSPVELDPIEVVAERRLRGPLVDFERRRRRGMGTYFTREDIESRAPYAITDLLRTVPGVRVIPAGQFGEQAVRLRGSCRPTVYVDGIRTSIDRDIDHILPPETVEAIEVYKGAELPARFLNNPCGAIIFWTRVPRSTGGHGLTWTRVGVAAGFVLMAILAIN